MVSQFTEVELVSAFARRRREGSIDDEELEALLSTSSEELASLVTVQMSRSVLEWARSLLVRHPLRAADAIQLASCLYLQDRSLKSVGFVAFDQRLREAAVREGLELTL